MSRQIITKAIALKASSNGEALQPTPYESRVLKLIPAEVVSVYLGIFPFMQKDAAPWVFWVVFVLLLIADGLYKKRAGVVKWQDFLISGIAFMLWFFSIGGPVSDFPIGDQSLQKLSSYLVPVYTLFIPLAYK